jgi:hypothetical protein
MHFGQRKFQIEEDREGLIEKSKIVNVPPF